jgi:uncharacterized membrane protein YjjP (DUF1212 family)
MAMSKLAGMLETSRPDDTSESAGRRATHAALTIILRIGALLLGSGASTNDVETTMWTLAEAERLSGMQPTVISGLVSVSWDPGLHGEPITMTRVVRQRSAEYDRLADLAAIVSRVQDGSLSLYDVDDQVDAIEGRVRDDASREALLVTSASAAASTLLFGGGIPEAIGAAIAIGAAQPLVARLGATGFPMFFQNIIAPAIVTLVAVGLIGLHLPINGPIVITGAILLFLPGAALVACMRDLIDGENVSGTARLAEALLLGTAVALGVSAALAVGRLVGVSVALNDLAPTQWRGLIQVIAAVLAVGFFAMRAGAPRQSVVVSALLGGVGVATREFVAVDQTNTIFATAVAATVIGTLACLAARRFRSLATIWVGAASLPLLPGLLILRGLTAPTPLDGVTLLAEALATGFAIGIGVAVGDVLVSTLMRIHRDVVRPAISKRRRA